MNPSFLAIVGAPKAVVLQALDRVLSREGYEPFDPSRVPPRYPEQKREFVRLEVSEPDPQGPIAIKVPDWDRCFERAKELSRLLPAATVLAFVTPPVEVERWKAYRGGELILKVGQDPDNELFYNAMVSEKTAVDAFLQSLGRPVPRYVGAGELRLYISRRSRLYLES